METAPPSTRTTSPDPLGTRIRRTADEGVEDVLELRQDLASAGFFEFPLRERVLRLAEFHHPSFVHVRRVERAAGRHGALAIASDAADGVGLNDVLAAAAERGIAIPAVWALDVIRQLVDGASALHATARDVSHGALTSARILIAPGGEALVRDYVFGAAIEQLGYANDRYWRELGIPIDPDTPGVDQRLDLFQIGLLGLQLLGASVSQDTLTRAGRQRAVTAISASGVGGPLLADARRWLTRVLQLDAPFMSASDAHKELDALLARHASLSAPVRNLREWLPVAAHDDRVIRETPAAHAADLPRSTPRFPTVPAASIDADQAMAASEPVELSSASLDQRFEMLQPAAPIASRDADRPHATMPTPRLQLTASHAGAGRTLGRFYPAVALVGLVIAAVVALYVPINGRDSRSTSLPAAAPLAPQPNDAAADAQATTGLVGDPARDRRLPDGSGDPNTMATGTLQIRTQPAGVQVSVDGLKAGRSPVTLNVAPGEHRIEIWNDGASVKDVVAVQRDATTSVIIPLAAAPRAETGAAVTPTAAAAQPATGWVGITSPIDVDVFEGDQQIGTRETRRLMLPAGTHHLDIVNRDVGYAARRVVNVAPGKLTPLTVEVLPGTLAINALPWADVWLDGQSLGPTPIGNVKALAGTHEVIFRHPKLGEQRRSVVVSLVGITRVSVDMGKK